MMWGWYNWAHIWRYNDIFEVQFSLYVLELYGILTNRTHLQNIINGSPEKYPNLHYLAIERPARLRPDAVSVSFVYTQLSSHHILLLSFVAYYWRLPPHHGRCGRPRRMVTLHVALCDEGAPSSVMKLRRYALKVPGPLFLLTAAEGGWNHYSNLFIYTHLCLGHNINANLN
jgi:hypothetical protein